MEHPKSNKRKKILNKIYKRTRKELKKCPFSPIPNDSTSCSSTPIISNASSTPNLSNDSLTDSHNSVASSSFIPDHQMCLETSSSISSAEVDCDKSFNETGSSEYDEFYCNLDTEDNVENSQSSYDKPLTLQLGEWAIKHNINHAAINSLLHILKPFHEELHLDARTLLKTQRKIELKSIEPGFYHHLGLRKCIENIITSSHLQKDKSTLIELCINIDGLPIAKSSGSQCYPILCKLFGGNKVNIIGLYHGNDKPKNANDFLEAFVIEAMDILNNGILFNGHHYQVKIKAFICDVPAKSFIRFTRGHSGYYSCTKCTAEGVYIKNRVCFPSTINLNLRNHSDFINKKEEEHHTGTSILENLPGIDMIRDFPVEYMHLVCLGVVKKLIVNMWIDGSPKTKLSFHQISSISESLIMFKSQIPKEFNRKPRRLAEAKRWKATEFRLFLYYLGPVVLQPVLSKDKYINFLTLHVAMTLLTNEKFMNQIDYAKSLSKYFVDTFIIIYGEEYVSHNVHNLMHLCDDVRYFGSLDRFSAFPFENYMQTIKRLVRKGDKPLQQICKRLTEIENTFNTAVSPIPKNDFELFMEHSDGPLLDANINKQYKKLKFPNYVLALNNADNCCCLHDGSLIVILNFVSDTETKIIGKKFQNLENFYIVPCESSKVNIYKASNLGPFEYWHVKEIAYKCMKLKISDDQYVILPLLHT